MPTKTIMIPSVGRRAAAMTELLDSIAATPKLDTWRVVAVLQEYPPGWDHARLGDVVRLPVGVGPHLARLAAYAAWESQIWCNLDDDTIVLPSVDYDTPTRRLLDDRGVGLISCGWVRAAQMTRRVYVDAGDPRAWVPQAIVYTGGGLLYRRDLVAEIRRIPDQPYLFDNVADSLSSFLAGYQNFRYRGSLIVHKICGTDGRTAWVRQDSRVLPDPSFIRMEPCAKDFFPGTNNNWNIPGEKCLTKLAWHRHYEARRRLGFFVKERNRGQK